MRQYAILNNKSLKKKVFVCLRKSCKGWNKEIMCLNTLCVYVYHGGSIINTTSMMCIHIVGYIFSFYFFYFFNLHKNQIIGTKVIIDSFFILQQ
jgi:hypothetical protein